MIPHKIHQTWKSESLPNQWKIYQNSWISLHTKWEYRFWTDQANLDLVKTDYPWLLKSYLSYPYPIQRADMARILYLHKFGGLYVDFDFECLKPFDDLIKGHEIILGYHDRGFIPGSFTVEISNAIIGSVPKHPVWMEILETMIKECRPRRFGESMINYVLNTTGPYLLTRVLKNHQDLGNKIMIYPKEYFFSSNWIIGDPEERKRLAKESEGYAIHYFDNTWLSRTSRVKNSFFRFLVKTFPRLQIFFNK